MVSFAGQTRSAVATSKSRRPSRSHRQLAGAGAGQMWVARYNQTGNGYDRGRALGVSPDGSTVFVTGDSVAPNGDSDYATLAYDALTGNQLWVGRYDGGTVSFDTSLALSPDGSKVY